MASKQILKDCGRSPASALASCSDQYADQAANSSSLFSSRWVSGAIILGLIVAALSYIQHSYYLGGYATKDEVARLVSRLPEKCRVVAGHRISAKISEKGAPLTRADMQAIPQNEADCDAIRQQLIGVAEGAASPG